MNIEQRLEDLQRTIETMDSQLETVSAELLGFKLAFATLISLLPITERDVTAAREVALAQAEDETELAGMSPESTLVVFSAIQKTMGLAGDGGRHKRASQNPDGA